MRPRYEERNYPWMARNKTRLDKYDMPLSSLKYCILGIMMVMMMVIVIVMMMMIMMMMIMMMMTHRCGGKHGNIHG